MATTLGHQAWVSHAADQHEAAISLAMQAKQAALLFAAFDSAAAGRLSDAHPLYPLTPMAPGS